MTLVPAIPADAPAILALHTDVADDLTRTYGRGPWSSTGSERGVLHEMRTGRVLLAREGGALVGMLKLATRKPWAIDTAYFAQCTTPLYLTSMAVAPGRQRQGIGRRCLTEARNIAKDWPAQTIRLDAFDAEAGAGGFYSRCGFHEVGRVIYRETPLIYFELLL